MLVFIIGVYLSSSLYHFGHLEGVKCVGKRFGLYLLIFFVFKLVFMLYCFDLHVFVYVICCCIFLRVILIVIGVFGSLL